MWTARAVERFADRLTLDPDLGELVRAVRARVDRLLRLGVVGGERHLLDLLDRGDAGPEGVELLWPFQLDRALVIGLPAEVSGAVLDHELEADALGEPPDEVPVGLVVLLDEVVRVAARVGGYVEVGVAEDPLDDVARGLVLEGAHVPGALQRVRAVEAAHEQPDAPRPELDVERDDGAVEQRGGGELLAGAELDLEVAADLNGCSSTSPAPFGKGGRQRAHVGEAQVVEDAHLADALGHSFVDGLAVDEDRIERDVSFLCGGAHAASSLGIVREVPLLMRRGSSMWFASAIGRQFVGSR